MKAAGSDQSAASNAKLQEDFVMEAKQACTAREEEQRQPVIVELTAQGTARVRQAPPDVLVMFVESKEITASGNRSIAAGSKGSMLVSDEYMTLTSHRPQPREIAVAFPG